jgi:hypothetical protein
MLACEHGQLLLAVNVADVALPQPLNVLFALLESCPICSPLGSPHTADFFKRREDVPVLMQASRCGTWQPAAISPGQDVAMILPRQRCTCPCHCNKPCPAIHRLLPPSTGLHTARDCRAAREEPRRCVGQARVGLDQCCEPGHLHAASARLPLVLLLHF